MGTNGQNTLSRTETESCSELREFKHPHQLWRRLTRQDFIGRSPNTMRIEVNADVSRNQICGWRRVLPVQKVFVVRSDSAE